ncbi:MAG: GNAT family N-acetyltransferase [Myxococcales bacterium]|nr:MAG: GNAT family N-acetyltransferase [Myxococcales bacterium]
MKAATKKTDANGRHSVEIRPMDIDDLATVFHLGEKLFTSQDLPNLYRTWDEFEVVDFFQTDPDLCLVAEVNGRVRGFVLGTTIEKSKSSWKYGYLTWIGVDPSLKNSGVGKRLLKAFIDAIVEDGARILLVDTEANNAEALSFFKKMGFGSPMAHIYLSMNIDSTKRRRKRTGGAP